jgi:hypothetical protein
MRDEMIDAPDADEYWTLEAVAAHLAALRRELKALKRAQREAYDAAECPEDHPEVWDAVAEGVAEAMREDQP